MGVDLQVGGNYMQCCSNHNFYGFLIISTRSFYEYYEAVQGKALVKEMCMSQQEPCNSGYICSNMQYSRAFGCVYLRNFCSSRYSDQTFTRWTCVCTMGICESALKLIIYQIKAEHVGAQHGLKTQGCNALFLAHNWKTLAALFKVT